MPHNEDVKRWEEQTLNPVLRKFPEREAEFKDNFRHLYTCKCCLSNENGIQEAWFSGEFPFTRRVQPTMYRGRYWTMRQYAGYASAHESNLSVPLSLQQGADRVISGV